MKARTCVTSGMKNTDSSQEMSLCSLILGKALATHPVTQAAVALGGSPGQALAASLLPGAVRWNNKLSRLPPLQVALCSSLLAGLVCYLHHLLRRRLARVGKHGYLQTLLDFMKSLPYVRDIVAKENAKVLRDLRAGVKEIHVEGVDPLTKLPKHKCDSKIVLQALRRLHSVDKEPELRTSTMSGTMYICDKKHLELLNSAYGMYALTNPLHGDCFPSVNRLEREVVGMTASILGGGPAGACVEACGTMTSGGTESIMTAVRTTRDFMCHTRGIDQPELVMAVSAHPAFDKACRYFGIKQHRIPVSKDYRADVKAMARAVNGNTIMLVVSAPGYPHGVMDPVEAAASVARAKKVCLHVDCCLGGFVLPFARKLGYNVPPFHFEVPGVTSISVDTHKYAMAQKGSSVVLYHSRALRKFQFTSITDWTGGLYVSPSHPGSRSGSLVAQTWAAMVHLGEEGYMEATKQLMEASIKLQKGIVAIPGLKLIGQPDMCLVAWTATNVNILELNDVMTSKGWTLNVLQFPNSVHMCLTMSNVDCVEMLIKDLQDGVNDLLKHGSDPAKGGKAPIYGMATSLPDRGAVNDILIMYQDVVCG